jgi:hypothetical protein
MHSPTLHTGTKGIDREKGEGKRQWTYLAVALCGGFGTPFSSNPVNSGPNSFAADVKVESNVDKDSVMKMMFVMENTAVPK